MKKLQVMAVVTAIIASITGCKHIPTPETVETVAYSIGVSAGYVTKLKVDDQTSAKILDIVDSVKDVVPSSGQTFEAAWTPIVEKYVAEAVKDGKLTEDQAVLIKYGTGILEKAIDYVFIRHPEWAQKQDLVAAAVKGLCKGYASVFNANTRGTVAPDADACAYLMLEAAKMK